MLCYGLAGFSGVMRLPVLIDIEERVYGHLVKPREAARHLVERFRELHADVSMHLALDAAFSSFKEAQYYHSMGVGVTMSLNPKHQPWLFELLLFRCDNLQGRVALYRGMDSDVPIVASVFHNFTRLNDIVDIRTITTSFTFVVPVGRR